MFHSFCLVEKKMGDPAIEQRILFVSSWDSRCVWGCLKVLAQHRYDVSTAVYFCHVYETLIWMSNANRE
jgi:hypothetical protein